MMISLEIETDYFFIVWCLKKLGYVDSFIRILKWKVNLENLEISILYYLIRL